MANFCKQCSIENFGKDFLDMHGCISEKEAAEGFGAVVICEGCGVTTVDHEGVCQGGCARKDHGTRAKNTYEQQWLADKHVHGWEMPFAAAWKRLPVIRHIRVLYLSVQVSVHESFWRGLGRIPTGYDHWVLYGIWRGWERK